VTRTTRELLLLVVQVLGTTYLLKNACSCCIWFAVLWLLIPLEHASAA
jgi:hypothetical protein